MNATRKVKLKDINVNLTCRLCLGYLIDATTIIECLHSFCKTCIITYLDKSEKEEKYCPVCDVQLHQTKPLTSIRADLMLQEIVYKLVPGLFKNEMKRRRKFYDDNGVSVPANQVDSGQVFEQLYTTSDDPMHLSLEYVTDDDKLKENTKRYLKCPAAVPVVVLKKLLTAKYGLEIAQADIDVMFGDRILPDDFLLMDVAYKYSCSMNWNKPLTLRYRIRGQKIPVPVPAKPAHDSIPQIRTEAATKEEQSQTPHVNTKRVCNENGSNIMPSDKIIPSQVKIPPNGFIGNDVPISPIKTPNGKFKRKRKQISGSPIVIENNGDLKNLKRLKVEKGTLMPAINKLESPFQVETQTGTLSFIKKADRDTSTKTDASSCETKEPSENGVSNGRSLSASSSIDKIAYDLSKRAVKSATPPQLSNTNASLTINIDKNEKLLLSNDCHSKTGPSGVTEIICEKLDPGSSSRKVSTAKPGFIPLTIPTPKNALEVYQSSSKPTDTQTDSKMFPAGGSLYTRPPDRLTRPEIMEKLKNKVDSKAANALLNLANDNGKSPNQQIPDRSNFATQKPIGFHNLPNLAPLSNTSLQRKKSWSQPKNGCDPLPEFSKTSGMSISVIPPGSTNGNISSMSRNGSDSVTLTLNSQSSIAITKKVNRGPKLILPKTNNRDTIDQQLLKTAKLIKLRKQPSPTRLTSANPGEANNETVKKMKMDKGYEPGVKHPTDQYKEGGNWLRYEFGAGDKQLPSKNSVANGLNGHLSAHGGPPPQPNIFTQLHEQYMQSATSRNVADVNHTNSISRPSMATGSNGSSMAVGPLAAFGGMAYFNANGLNQLAQFPFGYNLLPHLGFIDNTKLTTSITTPLNSVKTKDNNFHAGEKHSRPSNGLSTPPILEPRSKDASNEIATTSLDLTVPKSPPNESGVAKPNKSEANPLLTNLLKSPQSKCVAPTSQSPVSNGNPLDNSQSEGKPKSPIIRHLLQKSEERKMSRSPSPAKPLVNGNHAKDNAVSAAKITNERIPDPVSSMNGCPPKNVDKTSTETLDKKMETSSSVKRVEIESSKESTSNIKTNNNNCNSNGNLKSKNPFSFDAETLLRLSAQNNNINKLSNNQDETKNPNKSAEVCSATTNIGKQSVDSVIRLTSDAAEAKS